MCHAAAHVRATVPITEPNTPRPCGHPMRALDALLMRGGRTTIAASTLPQEGPPWQPLYYYTLYRLTLSTALLTVYFLDVSHNQLGTHHPGLFVVVNIGYVASALLSCFAAYRHWPRFVVQVNFAFGSDLSALMPLMHANGGMESTLGVFVLIAVLAAALLRPERPALSYAALATLAVLSEQFIAQLTGAMTVQWLRAGVIGVLFFAAAVLASVLALRLRASEDLALRRGVDLANMQQLTAYIIQHLRSGIVVVDTAGRVRLANESAWYLLGNAVLDEHTELRSVSRELAVELEAWRHNSHYEPRPFRRAGGNSDIVPRFATLGTGQTGGAILFLEDSALLAQQAQQMKLASLGQFTASIAHEVRNPLGAISHAAQLLAEAPGLPAEDLRLAEIITTQCRRVNEIIESILQLSRREASRPQNIALLPWLNSYLSELCTVRGTALAKPRVNVDPPDTEVRIDPNHLRQIVTNLCDNALRHGAYPNESASIELHAGTSADLRAPFLDVIDHGPGVDPAAVAKLFEPFYTTATDGTGLGLYITRELCEINHAQLLYLAVPTGGSCFRVVFADPKRQVF